MSQNTEEVEKIWQELSCSDSIKETDNMNQDELDQEANRTLKKSYAYWFIWILIGQLVVMNGAFISQGLGWLEFDEVTLRIYTTSTILEVFGVIVIIVHNLFPTTNK
ncbi:MAG: hypothetical protein R8L53_08845 [Mariprofundales bacterium]